MPYSDCTWNFDAFTGKKLSAASYAEVQGLRSHRRGCNPRVQKWAARGRPGIFAKKGIRRLGLRKRESAETLLLLSWQAVDPYLSVTDDAHLGEEYTKEYNISPYYFDLSAEFPEGFGYGLIYYDTGLGSSVPDDVIKAALEGAKRPAQVDPAKLKELWGYGRQ